MNLTFVPCKTELTFVFALIQRSKEREKKKEEEEKVESVKLLEARLDPRRALTYARLYWLFSLFFLFSSFFEERGRFVTRSRKKRGEAKWKKRERERIIMEGIIMVGCRAELVTRYNVES